MKVLAMRLHARERRKLRQIKEALRKEDPGLDKLLAGRPSPRRPARSVRQSAAAAGALAGYLAPPALLIAGLVLHATWLIVAGAVFCPYVPVIIWLPIRRHFRNER